MKPSVNADSEFFAAKLEEIVRDFDKFAIIAALETYESLNLSKLSLLLQKPRTTLLGHVKSLLENQLIEIDSKTTGEKWGKFYKITEMFKQEFIRHRPSLYETFTEYQDEKIEDINQDQINKTILQRKKFRKETGLSVERLIQYCGFAYFIQKFIFNDIAEMDRMDEESSSFSESDFLKSYFILFSRGFPVGKPIHVIRYTNLIRGFLANFLELTEEICKEIEHEDIEEEKILRYYLHVFGGSLKT